MRRQVEFATFVALATALHLALGAAGRQSGGDAGGVEGAAFVTLQGSSAQIEQVLADWTRPPEVQSQPIQNPDRPTPDAADTPPRPMLEAEDSARAQVRIAALPPLEQPRPPVLDPATTAPLELPTPDVMPAPQAMRPAPVTPQTPDVALPQTPRAPVLRPTAPRPLAQAEPPTPAPPSDAPPPPPKARPKPEPQAKPEAKPQAEPQAKPKPQAKTATRKAQASAASAAQKAAGKGGTQQAGNGGQTKAIGKGKEKKLIAVWGGRIRTRIERNKRLPRGAKGRGTAHLRIRVSPAGQLLSVRLTKSSGFAEFDQAAIGAVKRSGRFAKAPKGLTKASYSFSFSIKFKR